MKHSLSRVSALALSTRTLSIAVPLLLCSTMTYAAGTTVTPIYSDEVIYEIIDYDDWHFYSIELDKPVKLTVKLRKISDDADLYVARSKKPTKDKFQCAPLKEGTSIETCRINIQTAGTWYIGVHGKKDSDYQLGVNITDMKQISQINFASSFSAK